MDGRVGHNLVLVFAAAHSQVALRAVLFDQEGEMAKLSMYMSNLQKVRMDYSSHGRYTGYHIVFSLFSLLRS